MPILLTKSVNPNKNIFHPQDINQEPIPGRIFLQSDPNSETFPLGNHVLVLISKYRHIVNKELKAHDNHNVRKQAKLQNIILASQQED